MDVQIICRNDILNHGTAGCLMAGAGSRRKSPGPGNPNSCTQSWKLRLYIAGKTPKYVRTLANLKKMCEEHLAGKYTIKIVDLDIDPQLAKTDQIVALPTLVRELPNSTVKIVGDLSDTEEVLAKLGWRPEDYS